MPFATPAVNATCLAASNFQSLSAAKSLANHFISVITYDQCVAFLFCSPFAGAFAFCINNRTFSFTNCARAMAMFSSLILRFRASAVSTSLSESLFFLSSSDSSSDSFSSPRFLSLLLSEAWSSSSSSSSLFFSVVVVAAFVACLADAVVPRPRSRAMFPERKKESASSSSLFSRRKVF